MSKKTQLAAGTSPFAHLLSGFRGKKAEEEKPEDEEARKARRAEEDKVREEEDARRAEEDARRAEEDGTEPEGKAAKDDEDQEPDADAGDDDDEAEEDMDDKEAKAFRRGLAIGRSRENTRAMRIFGATGAAARPDLAATLAFTTRNTSAEADRLLGAAGAAPKPRGRLDDRMSNRVEARPGAGGGGAPTKVSFGDRVAAAVTKAGR